jgi:hypothetical protein
MPVRNAPPAGLGQTTAHRAQAFHDGEAYSLLTISSPHSPVAL